MLSGEITNLPRFDQNINNALLNSVNEVEEGEEEVKKSLHIETEENLS